jgi:ABC-type transport system involved in multi-copper enzyme maturation permease subunit
MFRTLVRRELLDHILRWRFLAVLVVSIILFVVAAFSFTSTYPKALKAPVGDFGRTMYGGGANCLKNRVANFVVAPRRPMAIQFAADGDDKFIASRFGIRADDRLETGFIRVGAGNYLLGRFQDIDWIFIVGIVLTFAAVVLSYDSISGEMEDGTLKLVLSNSISRAAVLAAKFTGAFLSILIPLILGCVASLLAVYRSALVVFGADLWIKLAAIFILSCLYLALVVWVGIFVSAWLGRPSASLVVLLVFYVASVLLVPGLAGVLGAKLVKVDPPNVVRAKEAALQGLPTGVLLSGGVWRSPGSAVVAKMTPEEKAKYQAEQRQRSADQQREVTRYRDEQRHKREQQFAIATRIAMVSPYGLYKYAACALAGTGTYRYDRFIEQLRSFGIVLQSFFLAQERLDPKSIHPTDFANPQAFSADINIPDDRMPQFKEARPTLVQTARDAVIPGGLLLGVSALAFFAAFLVFARKAIN